MNRIYKPVLAILILLLLAAAAVTADEAHGRDVETIVGEILHDTGASSLSAVSPDAVSPALLEELGDGVMGLLLDDWHHERMDAMLGGEGSDSLAAYHRDLGEQYIISGGKLNGSRSWGGGWMGPGGMMGGFRPFSYGTGRFSDWSPAGSTWFWGMFIGMGVIILILITAAVILHRRNKPADRAREILKARFARGEITDGQFTAMMKVLKS